MQGDGFLVAGNAVVVSILVVAEGCGDELSPALGVLLRQREEGEKTKDQQSHEAIVPRFSRAPAENVAKRAPGEASRAYRATQPAVC